MGREGDVPAARCVVAVGGYGRGMASVGFRRRRGRRPSGALGMVPPWSSRAAFKFRRVSAIPSTFNLPGTLVRSRRASPLLEWRDMTEVKEEHEVEQCGKPISGQVEGGVKPQSWADDLGEVRSG